MEDIINPKYSITIDIDFNSDDDISITWDMDSEFDESDEEDADKKEDIRTKIYHIKELSLVKETTDRTLRRTYTFDEYPTGSKILDTIVSFEEEARLMYIWDDGIDLHHIFFEGLQWNETHSAYTSVWGS
jgi:hypothetical protein